MEQLGLPHPHWAIRASRGRSRGHLRQQRAMGRGAEHPTRGPAQGTQGFGQPAGGLRQQEGVLCSMTLTWLAHCRNLGFRMTSARCTLTPTALGCLCPPPPAALHLCSRCAKRLFIFSVREKCCQITKLPQLVRAHSTQQGEKC